MPTLILYNFCHTMRCLFRERLETDVDRIVVQFWKLHIRSRDGCWLVALLFKLKQSEKSLLSPEVLKQLASCNVG